MNVVTMLACLVPLAACTATIDSVADPDHDPGRLEAAATGGLQVGLVSGNIYDDLYQHPGARMSDIAGLGTKFLRLEILANVDIDVYKAIVDTAQRYGIQVLALVQSNAVGHRPLDEDIELYANQINAKIDELVAQIPNLRYIEVENEPDGYDFTPLTDDHATKLGLLMVRVYEHVLKNRGDGDRPQIVGFDFVRPDQPAFQAVYNSAPITSHRNARPSMHLRDGLPVDIVSIHGYGNPGFTPAEPDYSYGDGATLREGMGFYLAQQFATPGPDGNRSLLNGAPVWVTEIGFSAGDVGGRDREAQGLREGFEILREFPQIQVAFAYDYRDDEGGGETAGLRGNSSTGYAIYPAYDAFQQIAGGRGRQTFSDVPLDYWAHDEIEAIFAHGVTLGCGGSLANGDLEFCPERPVTEPEIAVFIARAHGNFPGDPAVVPNGATRSKMACLLANDLHVSSPYRGVFDDVSSATECADQIQGLYDDNRIAHGYDNGDGTFSFRPDETLTRAQMSTFLTRAYNLK